MTPKVYFVPMNFNSVRSSRERAGRIGKFAVNDMLCNTMTLTGSSQQCLHLTILANIPGPSEPKTSQMNHILRPLVDELKLLERGIVIDGLRVRAKVFNWACDLPALRKTLGWLSHNANKVGFLAY
jgi:hypothetical protein